MNEEIKSLKNPTRVLTIVMFLAVFVSSVGADGLAQLLPGVPPVVLAGIVSVCAYAVAQYGTERRIVRAEELKDLEYEQVEDEEDTLSPSEELLEDEMMDDGI